MRLVLFLGLAFTAFSSTSVHAQGAEPLNYEAQSALDRGVAAAERDDWTRALAELTEAQKMARTNPQILYNLGIAHQHLGNNVAAIVWLHAYIASAPTGSDAAKVHIEIAKLEDAVRSEEETLFNGAIEGVNKLKPNLSASDLKRLVGAVAMYAGKAGYSQGFDPIADIEPDLRQDSADTYWYEYAITQAQDGDVDGARKSLRKVSDISDFMVLRFQYSENGRKPPPPPRQDAEDAFWDERLGGVFSPEKPYMKYWNVDFQSLCKMVPLIRDAKMRKQALEHMNVDLILAYWEWVASSPLDIWVSYAENNTFPRQNPDHIFQDPPKEIPMGLATTASLYGRELLRIHALDKRLSDHVPHPSDTNISSFCGN